MTGTGGYMVGAATTAKYVFDLQPGDIFWSTADCGYASFLSSHAREKGGGRGGEEILPSFAKPLADEEINSAVVKFAGLEYQHARLA